MPVMKPDGQWWMIDLTEPFRNIEFAHFESGAIYGDFAMLKFLIQPLDGVRYHLGQPPGNAEDAHLHRVYELADQCIKTARENFKLTEFTLTINFGNDGYLGISATLEMTVTEKVSKS
jgi:hypothetical protein